MKIPQVNVDMAPNADSNTMSVYIEINEAISDHLAAYIRATISTCLGIQADYRARDKIKYTIDSHLVQLVNNGQLFQDIDGTWDVDGFLWVNNEY